MKTLSSCFTLVLAVFAGQISTIAGLSGGSVEQLERCVGETDTLQCDSAVPGESCDNSVEFKSSPPGTPEIQLLHIPLGNEVNTCEAKNPTKPGCTGSGPRPSNNCKRPYQVIDIE